MTEQTRWSAMRDGDWVTNHPINMKGYWPRRAVKIREGVKCGSVAGDPGPMVGIYLDQDLVAPPIFYPLCKNPQEYDEKLKWLKENPEQLKIIEAAWLLFQAAYHRCKDWSFQTLIEGVFDAEDLPLHDTVDDLAVGYPLDDEELTDVSSFLASAQSIAEDAKDF